MSSSIGSASICVIEFKHNAVHTDAYASRLALVLAELNSGALGDGCHGSEAHLAALQSVIAEASKVTAAIENPPPRACNKHEDCDAADARAGIKGAVHCNADDCEECFGS